MNVEMINEGLLNVIEALEMIRVGLVDDEAVAEISEALTEATTKTSKVLGKKVEKKTAVTPVADEEAEESESFTSGDLKDMTYNEVKKLASELGVSAKGTRKEIEKRILEADGEVEEEAVEEAPAKKSNVVKMPAKKVVEEEEEIEEDPVMLKVLEATEEMEDEDIADLLTSVGKKASGKRQSLLSKLVDAVNEGLISLDEEPDEEESDEDTEQEDELAQLNDPEVSEITDARIEAMEELEASFAKKKPAIKSVKTFLAEYYGDEIDLSEPSEDELRAEYLNIQKRLIDDDGEAHDLADPYVLNDAYACCGVHLEEEVAEGHECQICGTVYDLSE